MNIDKLSLYIRQNTWFVVLLAVLVSFFFPVFGSLIDKNKLSYLLMFLMFLSCLDLRASEIISSLKEYKKISVSLLVIHLASPLIVVLLRRFFSDEVFLGLILASCIPAGRSAVFLANIYGGDPTKALVTTTLSNTFSPIIVPLVVMILAKTSIKIDALEMSSAIMLLVFVPLVAAFFFGKTKPGKVLNKYGVSLSVITLFLIIIGIITPIRHIILDNLFAAFGLGILVSILISFNFFLGYLIGDDKKEQITYALSSSYKNYTLATLLATTLFNPIVALPAIVYTVVNNLLLIPLQLFAIKK